SDQFVVSGLTDGHRSDQRLEQFIKPGGPTAFFKHDVRCAAQATKKIANDRCIGFDFCIGDDLSLFVENDDYCYQLMYIHTDILDILDDTHRTLLCSELICNQMLCHRVSQWGVLSYYVRGLGILLANSGGGCLSPLDTVGLSPVSCPYQKLHPTLGEV